MQKPPLVSILTTVFNRANYIAECIESVLASSYSNWEMIIVDDQSSDDSVKIAKKYEQQDERIKVYINDKNLGDYPNRNKAASYAKGKYLKYLDSDDLLYPYSLQWMVDSMEQYPEATFGLSFNVIDDLYPYPQLSNPHNTFLSYYLGKNILGCGPSASIIKRETFEEYNGFSGEQFVSDADLWIRLAEKYPMLKLAPALVWWRSHPEQQIQLESQFMEISFKRMNHKINILRGLASILNDQELQKCMQFSKFRFARWCWKLLLTSGNKSMVLKLWKKSEINFWDSVRAIFPWKKEVAFGRFELPAINERQMPQNLNS